MQQIANFRREPGLTGTPGDARLRADADDRPAPISPATAEGPRPATVIAPPSFSVLAIARAVGRLFQYRDLLYTLTLHRLNVRYKQSVLGPAWAILQPLALMLIYTVVFANIARVQSEGIPYPLFAFSALVLWLCFSTAVSTGTNSLVAHVNLVTKVYFPREILPITYVVAAVVDLLLASVVLGALMLFYGVSPTPFIVWAVPIVAVLTVFTLAVALALCAVQVRYRDIGLAVPLVLQLWLFASPIVYPLSMVPDRWHAFFLLNPMTGIIESFRRVVVLGEAPYYEALGVAALISAVLLPVTYSFFKHVESTMADVL